MIRNWLYGFVVTLFGLAGAFLYFKGKSDNQKEVVRRRLEAINEHNQNKRQVETADDKRIIDLISRGD